MSDKHHIRAVLFDMGGVVLRSPFPAIAAFEQELGVPRHLVSSVIASSGADGSWSRLERGAISPEEFDSEFARECEQKGYRGVRGKALLDCIASAIQVRPRMVETIIRLRDYGVKVGAITNNWKQEGGHTTGLSQNLSGFTTIKSLFDVFIESSKVGCRKPEREIYEHTFKEIGVPPHQCIFLDDIGQNLKTAKALGCHTIKVGGPGASLSQVLAKVELLTRCPLSWKLPTPNCSEFDSASYKSFMTGTADTEAYDRICHKSVLLAVRAPDGDTELLGKDAVVGWMKSPQNALRHLRVELDVHEVRAVQGGFTVLWTGEGGRSSGIDVLAFSQDNTLLRMERVMSSQAKTLASRL
eukprot:TRINITY_DN3272_c0_g1_i2.p1 TRINITY_DN3272_c0_g1~~TRINITY_DN3272_c0_g1_i2.p1  ORF type:complete len:355 (+),score=70.30 TRINITY_DN3272_c0_g1_i2:126-1190(+)